MKCPNVNDANKYARDVVNGKVIACRFVVLACQRHIDDLKSEKSKSFKFCFDKHKAERACRFIQKLPHTKGEWFKKKKKIKLEPWQMFIVVSIFGWLKKKNKLRRFTEVYAEIPRKNGKSILGACIALYMFLCDGEGSPEIFSGATTEKQAWTVFRPARLMVKNTPALRKKFGIEVNATNLNTPSDDGMFEPLIGNPGDGQSPSCALVDEYHEHRDNGLYDTMLTGMGARRQGLLVAITTAGYDIGGPCYDQRRLVIEMLEDTSPDDSLFGIIYTIDEGDKWNDPKALAKANPNLGVSVFSDYLEAQQRRGIKNTRFTNKFKTKHLNVWTSGSVNFFKMDKWAACEDKTLTLEQFNGEECYIGLDLARKLDLNSMSRLFYKDIDGKRHYYSVCPRFWVPEDTVFENDNRRIKDRFMDWVERDFLYATDGAEIDYREILEEAKLANVDHKVIECPIDPHGATALTHKLDEENLEPITITQNYQNMSDPMKELEAAIITGRFHHDGNPIMTWCISNVQGKYLPGNDDIVMPKKEKPEYKIDGATGLIMAIGRSMVVEEVVKGSIYNEGALHE